MLDIIGAKYIRDINPGEVVVFDEHGAQSHKPFPPMPPRPCIFEYIYFSRPDSIVGGRSVYDVRKAMGAELARESHVEADVVVPVPDSGVPAAIGYSRESGVPFELGIIRNHYVGRTFIQPTQSVRELGVRMKHSTNTAAIEGKRIVLIDDSLVRGTTSKKIVKMMRDAGAREVHFRIASPPITHPDYYGIDLPDRGGLLAATHNLEEMRDIIGADNIAHFLEIMGCGQQSATVRQVDAVIVGMEDRRRSETEVDLAGAGVAHHADDLFRGGAAHQRIVDQDDPLAFDRGAVGRMLHAHAEFARALGRLDEGAADIMVADDAEFERHAGMLAIADRGGHAGIRHRHHDVDLDMALARELRAAGLADLIHRE